MRIGIVTIHHVTNYGAVFQAYALSRALRRQGADVEIVDYRPPVAVEWYRQRFWKNGRPNIGRYFWARTFDRFIASHLPLSRNRYEGESELAGASLRYDALVAGSDQIWCTGDGSFRGFDPTFFLGFCCDPETAKYSYAASAGNTTDFGDHTASVRDSLEEFAALAVRDNRTAELVARTTGRSPTVVLDPVFLHDFQELVHDVEPSNDLVIFAARPERFDQLARQIAGRHNLRIVSLVNRCEAADSCRRVLGPVSWLRQLRGARAVLTDYFHGVAVALRFGRPVLADAAPGKLNKIGDLARRLQVEEFFLPTSRDPQAAIDRAIRDRGWFVAELDVNLREPLESSHSFLESIVAPSTAGVGS